MNILNNIGKYIRSKDELSEPGYRFFKYDGDVLQQTLIGGCVSITVKLCICYIAVVKGFGMVKFDDPTLLSVVSGVIESDHVEVNVTSLNQPIF